MTPRGGYNIITMVDDFSVWNSDVLEAIDTETTDGTVTGTGNRVILFNDSIHTFDEVIGQLMKAIRCSEGQAEEIANEVHSKGKAAVYEGELEECLKVSSVLEEIGLHTQVET